MMSYEWSEMRTRHLQVRNSSVRPWGKALGFTYLIMLFAIAVSGVLLAAGSVVWSQQAQRERERELLLIGKEFRRAIGLYYERTPGAVKRYPERLEDLLRDDRYLSMQRYLRRIYRDPVTGKSEWGLVQAPTGGIMGVYSLSNGRPIKAGGFDEADDTFDGKTRYSDWQFVYTPPVPGTQPPKPPALPKQQP
jgi:type II secretory pathway pseudopilin PulG